MTMLQKIFNILATSVSYVIILVQTKLFSDLYFSKTIFFPCLSKFLDTLVKPFFSCTQ